MKQPNSRYSIILYGAFFVIIAILVGMMISLQMTIMRTQRATVPTLNGSNQTDPAGALSAVENEASTQDGLLDWLREQIVLALISATATAIVPTDSSHNTLGAPSAPTGTSSVAETATPTPVVINITPTLDPQPTAIPPTVMPPTVMPPTLVSPTVIVQVTPIIQMDELPQPRNTSVVLVATSPQSPTPEVRTATLLPTPLAPADYVIGYLVDRPQCALVTEIAGLILEEMYDQQVRIVAVANSDELYRSLAYLVDERQRIDLTFCTIFPNDMVYLQQYDDKLIPFGGSYMQIERQRWHILGYAGTQLPMRQEKPCLYQFLTTGISKLGLDESQLAEPSALRWLMQHGALVNDTTQCQ